MGSGTVEYDEHGFPKPQLFDDERPRRRANVTTGRMGVLLAVIVVAALIGLGAHYAEDLSGILDRIDPNHPRAIARRMENKRLRGDLAGALEESKKLSKQFPVVGTRIEAMILGEMGRFEESVRAYDRVLTEVPDDHVALNNRAYNLALARQRLDEALRNVDKAIAIGGNSPVYVDTRAYIHYLMGRHREALGQLDRVLANPDDPDLDGIGEIVFHRGLVHRALGNRVMAERDFKSARDNGFVIKEYPEPVDEQPLDGQEPGPATERSVAK